MTTITEGSSPRGLPGGPSTTCHDLWHLPLSLSHTSDLYTTQNTLSHTHTRWKWTPSDTQSPLLLIASVPAPPFHNHTAGGCVHFGFHSALPIPDARPFAIRPLSIAIIAIIATTPPHQRPYQSRCHPGELSHGIRVFDFDVDGNNNSTTER